jgi:hypothetical protein
MGRLSGWCLGAQELGEVEHNHLLLKRPSVQFEYKMTLLVPHTPSASILLFSLALSLLKVSSFL